MIWVVLVISIILTIIGNKIYNNTTYDGEVVYAIGAIGVVITLGAALYLGCMVSGLSVIDDKIAMYQEENAKIEEQIAVVVKQYQDYESDIFESVAPESAVTLVALYPELKSDTLVQKQIDVYMENNEKIKELREEKIGGSVMRWWLYFGG